MGSKLTTLFSISTLRGYALSATAALLEYNTVKLVHIHNKKVGIVNRLVQLVIVGYILGYGLGYQQGYQKTGSVQSTLTTKLKGAWRYNGSYGDYTQNCGNPVGNVTFDVADLVIPPLEPNEFFVMTNLWKTCNQTQGICAEAPNIPNVRCNPGDVNHPNRIMGVIPHAGNGAMTGRCAPEGRCEISGWCPTEMENTTITYFYIVNEWNMGPKINAASFTVLIKNSIRFPTLGKRGAQGKRNIDDDESKDYFKTCVYSNNDRYCPILIQPQTDSRDGWRRLYCTLYASVIGLGIKWNCNLDWPFGWERCDPVYSAKRLDDTNVKISKGFNFRFAKYYQTDGYGSRDFIKAYGILFKVEVTGTGRIFDFTTLVLKLGSMIALLGIVSIINASVITDIIVLYATKAWHFYREKKYDHAIDPEKMYHFREHRSSPNILEEDYHAAV